MSAEHFDGEADPYSAAARNTELTINQNFYRELTAEQANNTGENTDTSAQSPTESVSQPHHEAGNANPDLVTQARARLAEVQVTPEDRERAEVMGASQAERESLLMRVLTSKGFGSAMDLVPFIGPAKNVVEGVVGTTSSGDELTGRQRVARVAVGLAVGALDFTGVGEGFQIAGKSVEALTSAAAKIGAERGIGRIISSAASFLGRHEAITRQVEGWAESGISTGANYIRDRRNNYLDETENRGEQAA